MKTIIKKYRVLILFLGICFFGCNEDYLEKYPKYKLTEGTFWSSADDAIKGLASCYSPNSSSDEGDMWTLRGIIFKELLSDNAFGTGPDQVFEKVINGTCTSQNDFVEKVWKRAYTKIARCNFFLENIGRVEMDEAEKAEMEAEVRFIRACEYFYMSQYYGGVPLIEKLLSVEEANSVKRATKEEVVNFVLDELTNAATNLPASRPSSEKGRAPKAAALAFKGRILMAEEQWSAAAEVYKSIIDLGVYGIDPRYQELFLDDGENSSEIILAAQYLEDASSSELRNDVFTMFSPAIMGGQGQMNPLNDIVDAYEMTDGKTIDESPLFDPANPYENRDPRLYYSVLLPNYSVVNGTLFVTHPDSINAPDVVPTYNRTGYGLLKYIDTEYTGTFNKYGGDIPIIRYAEVLLSYLECKLEAGDAINQSLLDQTINKVRSRAAVNMPAVTETDKDNLRTILRRERRVELAFEGIRYWDLLRWHIAHINLNKDIYGAKVCDGQSNCRFQVDNAGHYYIYKRNFRENVDYNWPIPQSERDINPNLEQNTGY